MDQREQDQDTVEFVEPTLDPAMHSVGVPPDPHVGLDPAAGSALEALAPDRFPVVWRGYDRASVDTVLMELEAELAELRVQYQPQAAVQQEIDRIGAATADILRVAQERAERITSRSREEANARVDLAHAEAKQVTADAEQRLRQLDADADAVWQERRRLIEDTRQLADRLLAVADDAADRFPEEEPGSQAAAPAAEGAEKETVAIAPVRRAAKPEPS
jgi:hypothetical protein